MEFFATFIVKPEEEAAFLPLLPIGYETQKGNTFLMGATTPEGQACGVIWLAREGLRLRVLHIETAAAFRNRGVASQLLDDLFTATRHVKQQIPITAAFNRMPAHEAIYRLLRNRREIITDIDARIYHISPACRAASAYYQKLCRGDVCTDRYFGLDAAVRSRFLNQLDKEDREMLLSIPAESYCQDMCFICGTSEASHSAIFLTHTGPQQIELSFFYLHPNQSVQQDLTHLLRSAAIVMQQNYADCTLDIFAPERRVQRLVHRIFPTGIAYTDRIRADWVLSRA